MTDARARSFAVRPSSLAPVIEHHLRRNRANWPAAVVSGLLNPVFMMLALGLGLGSQIDDTSSLGTTDYLRFVGPGVMAGAAMVQGGFYSLWPTMSSLRWEGNYKAMVRTPAGPADVATGHLLWLGVRVLVSSVLYVLVLLLATGWVGAGALLTPVVAGLTAVATAAPISAYAARVELDTSFALISRMGITPLFVFSGTFTTVDSLPSIVAGAIRFTPGYHGIELCRALFNSASSIGDAAGHLAVLLLWAGLGWMATVTGFARSLTP